jgi:chorismate synthase
VRARGVVPGLGSYAAKEERLDARLAAALMGIQAVKGVEIGEGFALAAKRGSEAHDEILPGLVRETNRAGRHRGWDLERRGDPRTRGDEAASDADAPAPLGRPHNGEPGEALVERSDTAAVEALAVVAEAAVAFELARAAREKFGGDAVGDFVGARRAYVERIAWQTR